MRALSLRILGELLQRQSERFKPYSELTILKLLEFEKDEDKEVSHVKPHVQLSTCYLKILIFFCVDNVSSRNFFHDH